MRRKEQRHPTLLFYLGQRPMSPVVLIAALMKINFAAWQCTPILPLCRPGGLALVAAEYR
jgi:hypothetical protein